MFAAYERHASLRLARSGAPCAAVILWLVSTAMVQAQTVRNLGPVTLTLYGAGQSDETGTGMVDWTVAGVDAFAAAISTWNSRILDVPARPVQIHVFWDSSIGVAACNAVTPMSGDGTTSTTFVESNWRGGSAAASPNSYDARFVFNPGYYWYAGSGVPAGNQLDFRTIAAHELGRALGFITSYDNGTETFSAQGLTEFDKLLVDGSGNSPLAGSGGTPGAFNAVANPVYFTGTNAVAVYGGNVPIYAPNPFQGTLSLTTLDQQTFPAWLMAPFMPSGKYPRAPSALEWAMMADMSWSLATTSSWTKGAATLNWTDSGNWSAGAVPNQNSTITFNTTGLATGNVLALGGTQSVHALNVNSAVSFSLGGGTDALSVVTGNFTRTTASSGTQTIASPVTLGGNALWNIEGSGRLAFSGSVGSAYSIYKFGGGAVSFSAPAVISGDLTISSGEVFLPSGGSLTANTVTGNGVVNFEGGALTQTGTNHLWLGGIRVGKQATAAYVLGPGMAMTTDTYLTVGRDSGGQGTFLNQSGTLTNRTNLFVGAYTGSGGTLTQQTDPAPGSPLPLTTVADTAYVGGESSGVGGGIGLVRVLSGSFSTARLYVGPPSTNLGGKGTFVQTGGTVTVTQELKMGGNVQGSYRLDGGEFFTPNINAWSSWFATFYLNGGTLHATAPFNTCVPIVSGGSGTIDTGGNNVTISSSLSGTGAIHKTGTGTLTLAGSGSFKGEWALDEGALVLADSAALQKATLDVGSGSVSFGSLTSGTLGGLSGSGSLALAPSFALTVGGNNNSTSFSGNLSGSGATLAKVGTGQLTLSGSNTYSGGTFVLAGILEFSTSQSLPDFGALVVGPYGSVLFGFPSPILPEALLPETLGEAPRFEAPAGTGAAGDPSPADLIAVPEPGSLGLTAAGLAVTLLAALARSARGRPRHGRTVAPSGPRHLLPATRTR